MAMPTEPFEPTHFDQDGTPYQSHATSPSPHQRQFYPPPPHAYIHSAAQYAPSPENLALDMMKRSQGYGSHEGELATGQQHHPHHPHHQQHGAQMMGGGYKSFEGGPSEGAQGGKRARYGNELANLQAGNFAVPNPALHGDPTLAGLVGPASPDAVATGLAGLYGGLGQGMPYGLAGTAGVDQQAGARSVSGGMMGGEWQHQPNFNRNIR